MTVVRRGAKAAIRAYQLSLSGLVGRTCRHLPTCSDYATEAIDRHGLWAGGWMGFARICRCGPGGTSGLDFVCEEPPANAAWYSPWRYGRWRGTNETPAARQGDQVEPASASTSTSRPVSTLNSRV